MKLQARHLTDLPRRFRSVPRYLRGWRLFRTHLADFRNAPRIGVVGAAGGLGRWGAWGSLGFIKGVGFEPDPRSCADLQGQFPHVIFHQAALGHRSGEVDFYETASPACSSCLEPDAEALAPYQLAWAFKVERTSKVQLVRFDELCLLDSIPVPHFLQVDVQGFEHEVFEGFGRHLDDVLAIECESHFKEIYRGQKTIGDLTTYLTARGFVLRHLEAQGEFGGEWLEVNAFFVRLTTPAENEKRSLIRLWEWVCQLPPRLGIREGL